MAMEQLTERIGDWRDDLQIDRRRRCVTNVALSGPTSRNGYRYLETALQGAVELYEHKPVFLDHAPDRTRPELRSTRDLAGTIVRPRYEQGRIRGDVQVLDTDAGRTFLALCDAEAPGIGMSHVVLAERSTDRSVVERISDVLSVDVVIRPATTTTFRESAAAVRGDGSASCREMPSRTGADHGAAANSGADAAAAADDAEAVFAPLLERLEAAIARMEQRGGAAEQIAAGQSGATATGVIGHAEHHATILPEIPANDGRQRSTGAESAPVGVSLAELAGAVAPCDAADAEDQGRQERLGHAAANASRLPEYARSPMFLELLAAAGSEARRAVLIEERCELLRRATAHHPRSHLRRGQEAGRAEREEFLRVLRGRSTRAGGD